MIMYDPSEARFNLHDKIIQVGQPVVGLEMATGADLMISPLQTKLPGGNINKPPGSLLFPKYAEHAMLVQRKSGHDLIGSIKEPGLLSILVRMQKWETCTCWLMVNGRYEHSFNHTVNVDGRDTGFHWHAYKGALDAWMLAGGLLHEEFNEEDAANWLMRWDQNLGKLKGGDYHIRPKHVALHLKTDPRPWRETLETFPGVGPTLSKVIADYCGDLKTALWWMSMLEETGVAGVGMKTKENWREWMSLSEDEILLHVKRDDPLVTPIVLGEIENAIA